MRHSVFLKNPFGIDTAVRILKRRDDMVSLPLGEYGMQTLSGQFVLSFACAIFAVLSYLPADLPGRYRRPLF